MQTKSLGNDRNVRRPRRKHKRLSSFCILLNANGELATTPEQKCFILDSFFEHLFTERQRPRLPGYIMLIWPRTQAPLIDQASLREIINGLPCNKSGGSDGLVAEVLKRLDPELLEILADCVHRRMCNEHDARDS